MQQMEESAVIHAIGFFLALALVGVYILLGVGGEHMCQMLVDTAISNVLQVGGGFFILLVAWYISPCVSRVVGAMCTWYLVFFDAIFWRVYFAVSTCFAHNHRSTGLVLAGWHFLHLPDKIFLGKKAPRFCNNSRDVGWFDKTLFDSEKKALRFYSVLFGNFFKDGTSLNKVINSTSRQYFNSLYEKLSEKNKLDFAVSDARIWYSSMRYIVAGCFTFLSMPLYCLVSSFNRIIAVPLVAFFLFAACVAHYYTARDFFKALHACVAAQPVPDLENAIDGG
jgi:hypothetical protein